MTDPHEPSSPAVDIHQHLWPDELVDRLRARSRPPYLRGWTLHTDGEPPYDVDPTAHDPQARVALDDQDGIGTACVSLSAPLGIESLPRRDAAPLIRAWHRGVAAKLRHDLVYFAKRPAALAVVEFEQRAAPHFRRWHGGIYRWCRLCRHNRCDRCRGATRPRLRRFHLEMFLHAGWQQITAAQPHCLSAYRRVGAVQPPRDLRGRCGRPTADE